MNSEAAFITMGARSGKEAMVKSPHREEWALTSESGMGAIANWLEVKLHTASYASNMCCMVTAGGLLTPLLTAEPAAAALEGRSPSNLLSAKTRAPGPPKKGSRRFVTLSASAGTALPPARLHSAVIAVSASVPTIEASALPWHVPSLTTLQRSFATLENEAIDKCLAS